MNIQGDYSSRVMIPFKLGGNTGKCAGPYASSENQHLVLAAQSGCQVALSELWGLYSLRIYRTLLKITKNEQDAEDALQDTFLRMFVAIGSFEGRANFYTWLTRIAINSALGMQRKRRSRPEGSLDSGSKREDDVPQEEFRDSAPNPEQIYAGREERERLMQAIRRLPTRLRKPTQVLLAENCTVKEIAYRFGISVPAAKARLHRARTMLGSLTSVCCEPKAQSTVS